MSKTEIKIRDEWIRPKGRTYLSLYRRPFVNEIGKWLTLHAPTWRIEYRPVGNVLSFTSKFAWLVFEKPAQAVLFKLTWG